jgi:exodeoxyribonuclease V beta subunit
VNASLTDRFDVSAALPGTSLALEASAGTGKTWTLTSLTVRYLAETDVTLPDVLLVTFTRAATAELRERVRLRIAEALRATEHALADPNWSSTDVVLDRIVGDAVRSGDNGAELTVRRDRLRRAAQQLDEATISTIHGFCQRMLQHAALEAGVDFDAVLLDDDADLLAEIVDDHLARELRPASADWVRYLRDCGGVDRARLTALARQVAGLPSLRLLPDLVDDGAPLEQPWTDAVDAFRAVWTSGGRQQAIDLVARMHEERAFAKPRQRTYTAKEAPKKAGEIDAWLASEHALPPGKVDRRQPHRIDHYPLSYFTVAGLRSYLPDEAPDPHAEVLDAAAAVLDAASRPATRFLHRAATYVWDELDRRKRQRTVLTFDDLLRRLADALEAPATRGAVRQAIRQRYQVALIDEFQDTDAVQWRIFSALFDPDEPFVLIGDPKQAIYAFRGADIHTYVAARNSRPELRSLQTNRRSDDSYVRACNALFGSSGAFATPDIPYHPIDAHHPDRLADPAGRAALQLRYVHRDAGELDQRGAGPGTITKGWADRALPGDVAAQVVQLLDGGVTVSGEHTDRPLAPQDIAVLVRTNRRAESIQGALRAAGVPAVIQRGGSVFATEEADALQRLLTALLRPGHERAAVAAAASVLFGRDAPTLVAQREALDRQARPEAHETDPDGTADPADPAATRDAAQRDELARTWDAWIDALTRWGERWQRDGVQPAIRAALGEDGAAERLLATAEGERRLTNVRHLVELLHEAESVEGLTPNRLLEWLQTHRADAADGEQPTVATELRLEADAEAVRVVTVHGSKGLQYPVVLCPDLWDGRIRVDQALTRFHDPDVADPREATVLDLDADVTGDRKQRSLALAGREARLEQLRLAYVALTRAEHRCIVWWGPFSDAGTSALASLLHGGAPDTPAERLARGEHRVQNGADDHLIADLGAMADAAEGTIDVEVVRELDRGARWRPDAGEVAELAPRPFTRGGVDRTWRRVSFTSLVRDADAHGRARATGSDEARDVDAGTEPDDADLSDGGPVDVGVGVVPSGSETAASDDVPLAGFPRGAGPGTFLHDVLERADLRALDDTTNVVPLLQTLERRHGVDAEHRETVLGGLRAAVRTPLGPVGGDALLADLGPGDRLNELRFELPLGGGYAADRDAFTLSAVAELFETSADPLVAGYAERLRDPALRGSVRGFLNGSIDLLARLPDGRFLVADYKSNWLGDRATGRSRVADYHPDALAEAMVDHHYVLQAVLYLVASHRYLRWRIPGYDYATHVAGGAYLFLRGMVGPDTPRGHDGHPHGVAALQPEAELITDISRLLDGGRP